MMARRDRTLCALACPIVAIVFTCSAFGQAGLDDLIERLGRENVPTGADVVVSQIEVPNSSGHYRPNPNHSELAGKSFTLMSGASGNSTHATGVGRRFYGLELSIAPGIDSIFCYEVLHWLQSGFLRANFSATVPPLAMPGEIKVLNHSWVGAFGGALDNEVLRRADYVVNRDQALIIVGVNDSPPHAPLLSHFYNGISVGKVGGSHAAAPSLGNIDGPGRIKPEIVGPGGVTSHSTPMVAGAAALLVETARTDQQLRVDPDAEAADVIKAALLAGADHGSSWSNNPILSGSGRGIANQPLDDVFGAGTVNINRSHMILTGGRHAGAADHAEASAVNHAGWDRINVPPNASRYWRFNVPEAADEVSILTTWNRQISASNMNAWSVANFELTLWRLDGDSNLNSLVGDAGLDFFEQGNVVSASDVDNVEHLYIGALAAGDYVLELQRVDALSDDFTAAVAWMLPEPPAVFGDLNGDGVVDVFDLIILINNWGPCEDPTPGNCPADLNEDGIVDVFDLILLINHWG